MVDRKPARRGLASRLAWSFSAFVLVATLAVATWMTWWDQRESLIELRELTATNVEFVAELRLPRTRDLARRLAHILDMGVGFHYGEPGVQGDWPPELTAAISRLVSADRPEADRVGNYEIGAAPFSEGKESLILVRKTEAGWARFAGSVMAPALLSTLACAFLALWTGRKIVSPIRRLVAWLPNLEKESDGELEPVAGDITARRDEIGEFSRSLEKTAGQLRREQELRRRSERLATMGRIATGLAHEIKNPVAAIGLHAELLARTTSPGEDQESIAMIREEAENISDLVNQWLYVARTDPGKREPHDLNKLIEKVGRRLKPVLDHARSSLELETGEAATDFPVSVDGPRIEQAFRNLILNAAQAMPSGGKIRIILDRDEDRQSVTAVVEDEGTGFSEDALTHFGEPFFSEREGGMGIGLTVAREVIQAHGGSLDLGARLKGNTGARLICRLPLLLSEPVTP